MINEFDELMERLEAAIRQGRDEHGGREVWLDNDKVFKAIELYMQSCRDSGISSVGKN